MSWLQRLRVRDKLALARGHRSRRDVFKAHFENLTWGCSASASGHGSTLEQTRVVCQALPGLLQRLGVKVLVDVPCGDWHWMRTLDLPLNQYIGLDVVPDLVAANRMQYKQDGRRFDVHDVTRRVVPRADLILCRDLLVHLCDDEIRAALNNMKASGSQWLLTTTFTGEHPNTDITTGSWRPLNLQKAPWNFLPPTELIVEECTVEDGAWPDKSMGLWRLDVLQVY